MIASKDEKYISANKTIINKNPAKLLDLKNLKKIIYLFLNKFNGKIYVGQYKGSFNQRYSKQCKNWYKYAKNKHFKSALQVNSGNNFLIFILESDVNDSVLLDELEVIHIKNYESNKREFGYNKTIGGNRTTAFSEQIKETFRKKRESWKDKFIERSKITHGDKFDYSSIKFHGMSYKVENIKCNKCSYIFNQIGTCHVKGQGCRVCGNKSKADKLRLKPDEFLLRSEEKYKNRFEYDMSSYVDIHSSILIYCKECQNWFSNTVINHLYNNRGELSGCKTCGTRRSGLRKRLSLIQIDPNTNKIIKIHKGITASCEKLKLSEPNLRLHVNNNSPYHGFLWKIE